MIPNNNSNKNKFLFDLNNFDQPIVEEEIIEEEIYVEPPPPMFSEDDLEAAKAVAQSRGYDEGMEAERQKRENFIADSLKTIADHFATVFAAETYRERQYEEESLHLALEIITLLAPSLQTRLGEEALKHSLKKVLKSQSAQSEIRVEVHPESTNDIGNLIDNIWPDKDNAPRYKVVANSSLENGACALSWKDGGMVRDPKKTANDIKTAIEGLLVEQVLSKGETTLTADENNAIKEESLDDSSAAHPATNQHDTPNEIISGEQENDG